MSALPSPSTSPRNVCHLHSASSVDGSQPVSCMNEEALTDIALGKPARPRFEPLVSVYVNVVGSKLVPPESPSVPYCRISASRLTPNPVPSPGTTLGV